MLRRLVDIENRPALRDGVDRHRAVFLGALERWSDHGPARQDQFLAAGCEQLFGKRNAVHLDQRVPNL